MADIAASGETRPRAPRSGTRRAAGIYGSIITAAILDTAGGHLSTGALVVSVVVTLLVYWLAEEYAVLLGEHVADGILPRWAVDRAELAATWTMISASFAPLLALVLARVAGASASAAATVGVTAAVLLLTFHGWWAGRAARLHGRQLVLATLVATALGLVMIALKELILFHLH